ncbi:MAG: S-layer homology domain-containing protein, partial [Cyanobacteria bacterium J06626_18]
PATAQSEAPPPPPPPSKRTRLREAIAPYLSNQQLMLITQAEPMRVLYSEEHGQRRLYQVVFRDRRTQQPFQIQAKLTLDATRNSTLQQLLSETPAGLPTTAIALTAAHVNPSPRQARGTFFDDAIALVMAGLAGSGRLRPISIPLRALIPQQIEGFLCVSQPGCEPALRPLFQQPRAQWTLGEATGHVAAKIIDADSRLLDLVMQPDWRWHLQHHLIQRGIPLFAFDDVPLDDPDFETIQMGAIANVVRTAKARDLSFRPEVPVTRSVVASALTRLPGEDLALATQTSTSFEDVSRNHWAFNAIQKAIAIGVMGAEVPGVFAPSRVLSKRQLWHIVRSLYPANGSLPPFTEDDTPARRRHLSRSLYPILKARLKL